MLEREKEEQKKKERREGERERGREGEKKKRGEISWFLLYQRMSIRKGRRRKMGIK